MKKALLCMLAYWAIASGCAPPNLQCQLDLAEIRKDPEWFEGKYVRVMACVDEPSPPSSAVRARSCIDSKSDSWHVDLVGRNTEITQRRSATCISGVFMAYSNQMIGIGYLDSDLGVIDTDATSTDLDNDS